jgi:tetratricopeptide (TPR) repeat protein
VRSPSTAARRWLTRVLALAALAFGPSAEAGPVVELRFDGQAFDPRASPDFTCFSVSRNSWVVCPVTKGTSPGIWALERLEPGAYRMHVGIDENPNNPRRYPGDYEAQVPFEITETGPERLVVDLPRLIHLLRPGDNDRALEGMLTGCATQPTFETPRASWGPVATIEVAWAPVVAGAEYRYTVFTASCAHAGTRREVVRHATGATAIALDLSPSAADEYYVFRVEAWNGGRLVGDLYTHDGGTHSWNYRFRVKNTSLPRWAYVVTGAGLALLLVLLHRSVIDVGAAQRRRRLRLLVRGAAAALGVVTLAAAAYAYVHDRAGRQAEAERATREVARQQSQREFIAAFASAAPRPEWWDRVETPYRVDNLGDLLSAWQGHPRDARGERQFFKAAYQSIVDHSDDGHVVASAILLLNYVARDYPHRLGLARFGYERYFAHRQRTDNCANCMVGDTTQGIAHNLSQLYVAVGRHDEAIEVGRRLIAERATDVSPYKLAETWNQMAWAHWQKGERARAIDVVREALARYGTTVRGEDLQRTLAAFEREGTRAREDTGPAGTPESAPPVEPSSTPR